MTILTPINSGIKINWTEQKVRLKAKFPTLVDADLNFEKGMNNEMFTKLCTKLGVTQEELNTIIDKL